MSRITRSLLCAITLFVVGAALVPTAADAQYRRHHRHHHHHYPRHRR